MIQDISDENWEELRESVAFALYTKTDLDEDARIDLSEEILDRIRSWLLP